jgi:2-polyprenyl-3-methyl-5-hydroxy-6-metoxy-1,4-benzoquinol methylase
MPDMSDTANRERVGSAWGSPGSGERYVSARFATSAARGRDLRLVERALERHRAHGAVLDVPSGAGRLAPVLARAGAVVVAVDASAEMLAADGRARRVRASIFDLPFPADAFDAVICCRLLHHLARPEDLERAVGELVRVSARLVIASFWDAASLPALRRRLGLKRPEARSAIERSRLAAVFARAGARVVGFEHSMRFVSQQAFAVAEKLGADR